MSVEVLERAEGYTIALWGPVELLVWNQRSSAQGIDHAYAALAARAGAHAGGMVLVNVVPRQPTRPPDEETRAAMRRAMASPVPALRGVCTIHEGEGFVAASIRALVARLAMSRAGVPFRFFRDANEAAAWAAELLRAPGIDGARLGKAIQEAREPGAREVRP